MKFSIRDLLLATVIVALAVGWCVNWRVRTAERRGLIEERDRAVVILESSNSLVSRYQNHLLDVIDLLRAKGWKVDYSDRNGFLQAQEPSPTSSAPAPNPPKP